MVQMREILFKAKRLDNDEWTRGVPIDVTPMFCFAEPIEREVVMASAGFADWGLPREIERVKIDPSTACQSTGKRDKKGVQIFEGDVARLPAWLGGDTAVCKWVSDDSSVEPVIGFAFINDAGHIIGSDEWDEFEIIGNIYDKEN